MRGRKPTPTALKIAKGNPGKRPLNKNEPKPKASKGVAPSWLMDTAKTVWKRLAPGMLKDGRLTVESEDALACYCQNVARLAKIEREIRGGKAIPDRSDMATIKELQQLILKFAQEFGITPSARSRIVVGAGASEDDFDKFLKVKHG